MNTEKIQEASLQKTSMPKASKTKEEVPIYHKLTLTLPEAAEYSNIGINRLSMLISEPGCPFALFVGNKRLIKRKLFDEYINSNSTHFI